MTADPTAQSLRHLIRILVFIDDPSLMSKVIENLQYHGYAEIRRARDPDELGMTLRRTPVDLVISVSRTEHVFVGHFIRDLRHGLLECHPFPVVLMLLPSAEDNHVRAVINAGVDDLLITPLQGDALVRRLGNFILERRPFTVTHDYIGPNRRLASRPGTRDAPMVQVPNPVRARAYGLDEATLQQVLHEASLGLNRIKIKSDGSQIGWLVRGLTVALAEPQPNLVTISDHVSRIASTANEIARRAAGRSGTSIKDQAHRVVEASRAIIFTQELAAEARMRTLLGAARKLADQIATEL